jgi:hypothetical protein
MLRMPALRNVYMLTRAVGTRASALSVSTVAVLQLYSHVLADTL